MKSRTKKIDLYVRSTDKQYVYWSSTLVKSRETCKGVIAQFMRHLKFERDMGRLTGRTDNYLLNQWESGDTAIMKAWFDHAWNRS